MCALLQATHGQHRFWRLPITARDKSIGITTPRPLRPSHFPRFHGASLITSTRYSASSDVYLSGATHAHPTAPGPSLPLTHLSSSFLLSSIAPLVLNHPLPINLALLSDCPFAAAPLHISPLPRADPGISLRGLTRFLRYRAPSALPRPPLRSAVSLRVLFPPLILVLLGILQIFVAPRTSNSGLWVSVKP